MDRSGHQLLARASFAHDQDRAIGGRDLVNGGAHLFHGRAVAGQCPQVAITPDFAAKIADFRFPTPFEFGDARQQIGAFLDESAQEFQQEDIVLHDSLYTMRDPHIILRRIGRRLCEVRFSLPPPSRYNPRRCNLVQGNGPMSPTLAPLPLQGTMAGFRRFTVPEYHKLIEIGVLTEDDNLELLEGYLVHKMARN